MDTEIVFNIQSGPFWDWRVAIDLFLGGAGVGALLFAVALDEVFKGRYRRICQTAAWLSPILVTLGLVFLLFKLGRPFNLFMTFQNYAPTSPLWWGGIFQPLLVDIQHHFGVGVVQISDHRLALYRRHCPGGNSKYQ